jgi:transcriptional regulator with XRE-family HTH domain
MDYKGDFLRLLGLRIAELRQQQQLTIENLALAAGLDPDELVAIEAGTVDIPLTTIVRLAGALGISPGKLVSFPP